MSLHQQVGTVQIISVMCMVHGEYIDWMYLCTDHDSVIDVDDVQLRDILDESFWISLDVASKSIGNNPWGSFTQWLKKPLSDTYQGTLICGVMYEEVEMLFGIFLADKNIKNCLGKRPQRQTGRPSRAPFRPLLQWSPRKPKNLKNTWNH